MPQGQNWEGIGCGGSTIFKVQEGERLGGLLVGDVTAQARKGLASHRLTLFWLELGPVAFPKAKEAAECQPAAHPGRRGK